MSQYQLYEVRASAWTQEGPISHEFFVLATSREDAQRQADLFKFSAFHATGKVMGGGSPMVIGGIADDHNPPRT